MLLRLHSWWERRLMVVSLGCGMGWVEHVEWNGKGLQMCWKQEWWHPALATCTMCYSPQIECRGQSLNSLPHHSTTLDWHEREFLLWGISAEWDPDLIRGKGLNPFQVILIFHHYYFTFKKKKKNQNHYNTIAICVLKSNAYSGLQNESIICL